jgi:predicted dehydrogenase/threonine dehydrogenase-like Zn-dependent dehydrogenase
MKQVAQNYKSGELAVLDVPPPACTPGGVLVRSLFSLISTGTEMMKVGESKMSLLGKARARPDQLKKVLATAQQQGPLNAYRKAMNRLDSYTPLGYSLAGVVTEVGTGAEEFHVGQLVACAGNEFALHAEVNWVPVNLCVPVPDGVPAHLAAFATVGSIALQGVRQGRPQLGDTALVIGLGLVGQLVVQLLVASGVKVIGIDTVAERCRLGEKAGALSCSTADDDGIASAEAAVARASGGLGADQIFLAAGGSTNQPVELAARLARDRATVVDIGKCQLDLPWNAYYEKELDVRFSRSYGPGRYDQTYEVEGIDYPAGYVRWTERRNLSCFLDLLASGEIDPEPLISGTFPLEEAASVYARLGSGDLKGVGFLFSYSDDGEGEQGQAGDRQLPSPERAAPNRAPRRPLGPGAPVRAAFIGAGNYASSMLLPHLAGQPGVELVRVVTRRSLSALNAQRKFGFASTSTDTASALEDTSVDAIFIVTRHSSHAALVCQALEAGKAVFVEKPLALSLDELEKVIATVESTGNDRLMVGFNRRFSPMFQFARQHFGRPSGPSVLRYLVNAGTLAADSWYRNEELEGSRFAGEGGHFIDTLSWWLGANPEEVSTLEAGAGNLQVSLTYPDGSLGTVTYFTNGHVRFPKETFEAASGGRVARLDNFKRATVWGGRKRSTYSWGGADKGQRAQLEAFVRSVSSGGEMPIDFGSLVATTRATLAAERSLASGTTARI